MPVKPESDFASDTETSEAATNASLRKLKVKTQLSASADTLPSVELTEKIMFEYLSAEIAEQRGIAGAAYLTMLTIAQQTRDPRLARRAAEIALNAKRPDEALAAIRLWRETAPHSEEATQYYLGMVMVSDNLAEAQPILQQRLQEASPQARGAVILQIHRLMVRAPDKTAAFSMLEQLLAPYQSVPEAHLALAQAAFAQGNKVRARDEARTALTTDQHSELAALTLAQVTSDRDAAAKSLTDFLAAHPKSRDVRLAYARMLVEQKRYPEAQREFKTLLKDRPQDLTLLYALGLLSTQSNDLRAAEDYLVTYLEVLATRPEEERDPNQALLLLAQIAEERNDTQAALKWLDKIESETPQWYLSAQIKRAQLISKNGNVAGARKLLRGLRTDSEEDAIQLVIAEGQILRSANQLQEAITVMEGGLKRFPQSTDLLYDHAMLAEKLNNLDGMEASLRKIMKLAPNNQHAYNALGYSLAERNVRLPEAYALVEKALELAPEDPFIMDSMGWVHFRLGRIQEAENLLRRAYALRPDPEIAAHLGEVLWAKGQQEDAKKLWRDANIKDPKNDTLKSTLGRLQVHL